MSLFNSADEFEAWIRANADPALGSIFGRQTAERSSLYRGVFEELGDLRGDGSMLKVAGNLGMAVPELMAFAEKDPGLSRGGDKKTFVVESAVALFRLMDRGSFGDGRHVLRGGVEGIPREVEAAGVEDTFVRPMVEQAIERCHRMLKDL